MPLAGEYAPNAMEWVRDQVARYEGSGGTDGTTLRGMPVVIVTSRGSKTGKLRKTPLMRVEREARTPPSPRSAARPSTRSGTTT